jgi:HKD family nuclease
MSVTFFNNEQDNFGKALQQLIAGSDSISIAVSYLRTSGLNIISESLASKDVRVIIGLGHAITECDALRQLYNMANSNKQIKSRVYCSENSIMDPGYHPKVYIGSTKEGEASILIGSSNISRPAFNTNIEANLLLKGSLKDPEIMKITSFFERLWRNPDTRILTQKIIEEYSEIYRIHQDANRVMEGRLKSSYRRMSTSNSKEIRDHANYWIVTTDEFEGDKMFFMDLNGVDACEERFHASSFQGVKKGDTFIYHHLGTHPGRTGCDVGIAKVSSNPFYDSKEILEWNYTGNKPSKYRDNYPWRVKIEPASEYVFEKPVKSQVWLDQLTQSGRSIRSCPAKKAGALYRGRTIIPLQDDEAKVILQVIGRENPSVLKYLKPSA